MAKKTILVCDVCGESADQTVTLLIGRRRLLKDYCAVHLTEVTDGARRPGPARSRRSVAPKARARKGTKAKSGGRTRARTRRAKSGDVVARAKKLRNQGMSYRQIGDALMERGMKPPRAKAWNPVVIGRMFKRSAA